jgi:ERCC4-type nuclease
MLTIDDRVGSAHSGSFDFVRHLKRDGLPVRVRRLSVGDFAFTGHGPAGLVRVVIERKTTDEIITAIMDDRLTSQLPRLLRGSDFPILVVEGKSWPDQSGGLMLGRRTAGRTRSTHLWANYVKFQLTLMFKARVYIWPTRSKSETVQFIHATYDWFTKKRWKDHKSAYKVDETKPDEAILDARTLKRRVAAQLPGVGWVYSKRVDQHFDSIRSMMNADPIEWKAALHIRDGMKRARTLSQAIRQRDER